MDQSTPPPFGPSGRGEPPNRPLSAVEIELQQKHMLRVQVRERFARYGETVCDLLMEEVLKPRGLHTLIQQLGLRVSSNAENMLTSLSHFLAIHGPKALVERVRGGTVTRPALSGQLPLDSPSKASPAPAPLSGRIDPAPLIDIPGVYSGPDRRSGAERRAKSRRNELEAIMKNRRYGADRRQQGRRATDRRSH